MCGRAPFDRGMVGMMLVLGVVPGGGVVIESEATPAVATVVHLDLAFGLVGGWSRG